ncbi:MAG: bifunctional adenosylcobinamide kinase/adenosylcobinamide-phosphate guanylyltransferase [Oscillospiraceae bacterium]|nr:bifunctional adenosylcobinamide kinase/adenosylcobinamide-phosphate guanylyltransferase [Oscillospiraceae bacterium]
MRALVYGGSGSGKSAFAEDLAASLSDRRIYLATMPASGEESKARILRHRAARESKGFVTVEYAGDPVRLRLPGDCGCLLLEDAGNLAANALFERGVPPGEAPSMLFEGILSLAGQTEHLVIVTVDVFSDGICYREETQDYLSCLARLNLRLASWADTLTEVVCGLPIYHKNSR